MATPRHYKNKQGIQLPNNVIHMDSPHMRPEVAEWRKKNRNILLVEDKKHPLPDYLKIAQQPTTLEQGIKWTLQKIGINYKE
jgi:hypothetical protein